MVVYAGKLRDVVRYLALRVDEAIKLRNHLLAIVYKYGYLRYPVVSAIAARGFYVDNGKQVAKGVGR